MNAGIVRRCFRRGCKGIEAYLDEACRRHLPAISSDILAEVEGGQLREVVEAFDDRGRRAHAPEALSVVLRVVCETAGGNEAVLR